MSDDTRRQGVELGDLREQLREHEYPASQEELLEAYGDEELELAEKTATFEELVGPLNEDGYDSYDEIERAIMNMVGDEAIGRKNYSDRTPYAPGEERQTEGAPDQDVEDGPESF